jgi:formate-dependent nitrite reductase cytochrome c552 subunit
LPVASETCARCHTFGYPDRDITVVKREYASDEDSTESVTTLEMLTSRIHWHARPDVVVEYVAEDPEREASPYVRLTNPDGSVTEFMAEGTTERPEGALRRMDCLDCHSRPAHRLASSAEAAADRAIAAGQASRDLPFIKRQMVDALTAEYADRDAAAEGIRRRLSEFYLSQSQPATDVARAVEVTQRLYRLNVFPRMNVTWGTYKSQLGHFELTGCFRCHDDGHTASGDRAIRMDCDLCHNIQ